MLKSSLLKILPQTIVPEILIWTIFKILCISCRKNKWKVQEYFFESSMEVDDVVSQMGCLQTQAGIFCVTHSGIFEWKYTNIFPSLITLNP